MLSVEGVVTMEMVEVKAEVDSPLYLPMCIFTSLQKSSSAYRPLNHLAHTVPRYFRLRDRCDRVLQYTVYHRPFRSVMHRSNGLRSEVGQLSNYSPHSDLSGNDRLNDHFSLANRRATLYGRIYPAAADMNRTRTYVCDRLTTQRELEEAYRQGLWVVHPFAVPAMLIGTRAGSDWTSVARRRNRHAAQLDRIEEM